MNALPVFQAVVNLLSCFRVKCESRVKNLTEYVWLHAMHGLYNQNRCAYGLCVA